MSNQTDFKSIPSAAAREFYEKAQNTMANLFARWQDESKYENIADYAAPLKGIATKIGGI